VRILAKFFVVEIEKCLLMNMISRYPLQYSLDLDATIENMPQLSDNRFNPSTVQHLRLFVQIIKCQRQKPKYMEFDFLHVA